MPNQKYYDFDGTIAKDGEQENNSKLSKLKAAAFSTKGKEFKWNVFKQVVCTAASGCASIVVSKYLKANIPDSSNAFEKIAMGIGMYFITGIVGANVSKYAEKELEEWRSSMATIKEAADGGETE